MDKNSIIEKIQETRKQKALESLSDFSKIYFPKTGDSFEDSDAHIEIMGHFNNLLKNPGQKLALAAPRGFGKTEITSIFIIYAICKGAYKYILILSATSGQAKEMLKNIKTQMISSRLLVQDFPDAVNGFQVVTVNASFKVNDKIKISSFGLKQSFRGTKHGRLRPDLVIVDDLDSDNYLHNKEVKEKMREIFNGKVLKIGHERTNIIFNGNIFSKNTLIWDIFNEPAYVGFVRLIYRAIKSEPERKDLWERHLRVLNCQETYNGRFGKGAAKEFYQDQKEDMDRGFESLWPKRWGPCELMPQLLSDPDKFMAEMQNSPIAGESCFDSDRFTFWNKGFSSKQALLSSFGKDYKVCLAIDPSLGKVNGDYSALAVVARYKDMYYVLQVLLLRDKTDILFDCIFEIVKQGVHIVVIEANGGQDYLASELEKESIERQTPIHLKRVHQTNTKEMRIRGLVALVNTGGLQFNSEDRSFLQQMYEFPLGAHDDGPDALELAIRTLMELKSGFSKGAPMIIGLMKKINNGAGKSSPALDEMLLQNQVSNNMDSLKESDEGSVKIYPVMHAVFMRLHGSDRRGSFMGGN